MPQRTVTWTQIDRARLNRIGAAPGVVSARSLIQALARFRGTKLVTPAGAYDRAAIMVVAVEAAKAHQLRTGAAWGASMSVGLKAAWQAARAARAATAH